MDLILFKEKMIMKYFFCVLLALVFIPSLQVQGQSLFIEGKVIDGQDSTSLNFAAIRVLGTMKGTSTNSEGLYRIYLQPGKYTLVASYLGYKSDTVLVELKSKKAKADFSLNKSIILFPTVTITPGINPALAIIQQAINKKNKRASQIDSYKMEAYTKGIFKSNQDDASKEDSTKGEVKIVGILENTGVSYFKKPDYHKDVIIARKQTANFPPEINVMTGNNMVQSFYEDKIHFFDIPLPGPIANDALEYYDYYMVDSLAIDNKKVYKIHVSTLNESNPGFTGEIFIMDNTFDLLKVAVELNKPANIGNLLDSVKIFQQFLSYDSLYMPIDYRISVRLNLLGLIKMAVDLNSVMYNYKINTPENEVVFDKAIVSVLPEADTKDSAFWDSSQFIPNTTEEKAAYFKIDSVETAPKSLKKRLLESLLEGEYSVGKNFYITTPLNMYHFNRVEGHAMDFGFTGKNLFSKRFNTQLKVHYGFSDEIFKSEFDALILLGDYRTYKISFGAYKSIIPLFNESNDYNSFASSLFALAFNDDFLNYYYSKGFYLKLGGDVFPIFNADLSFSNKTDNSAVKNSDFTFSEEAKVFRENPPICDATINSVDFNLTIDFRDYIEDGYFRTRNSNGNSYVIFSGSLTHSSKGFLKSDYDFNIYRTKIEGILNSFRLTTLDYSLYFSYSNDAIPYQALATLPGSISGVSGNKSFRTLRPGEYFGNKIATLFLNYNFFDDFFRIIPIPLIKDCNLQVNTFFNAGWADISNKSRELLPVEFKSITRPLMEIGLGIGYSLLPFKLEFTKRLTHTVENSFSVGLNTVIFLR